ncbi:MAG: hypothetical protein ABIA63_01705 [bacterium]
MLDFILFCYPQTHGIIQILPIVKTGGLVPDSIPEMDFFGVVRGSEVTIGAVQGD